MGAKTKFAIIAVGLTAVGAAIYSAQGPNIPRSPLPDMTQPHTDPIQRTAARDMAISQVTTIRGRLNQLEPFARDMGITRGYTAMIANIDGIYREIAQVTPDGRLSSTGDMRIVYADRISKEIQAFFGEAESQRDRFTATIARYPDAQSLRTDAQNLHGNIRRALGTATPDVSVNTRAYTDVTLTKPLELIMPTGGAGGVQDTETFQMLTAVAREMDRLGAPQNYSSSAATIRQMMRETAPVDPRGSSELFHAHHIMNRTMAMLSDMRKNRLFDAGIANAQRNFSSDVGTAINRITSTLEPACEAVRAELANRNGFQGPNCRF